MSKTVSREAYLGVVQHGDDPTEDESEVVTLEYENGVPRTIEISDGTRITLLEPVGENAEAKAA